MRRRIVIIGGGFGGLNAARALRNVDAEITLIDRTNHHVFQPLLYQVATAALAPSDITAPIRWILRKQQNTTVLLAEVRSIDTERKVVCLDYQNREIPYDYLIVAAGSRHAYFGHEEWEPLAPGLKAIEDATEVRRRFLLAFERAEKALTDEERDEYLTFVIVGGGPTGVELSGAMPLIARRALAPDFRHIDTRKDASRSHRRRSENSSDLPGISLCRRAQEPARPRCRGACQLSRDSHRAACGVCRR
jgi:NADH dehydrogenase